MNNNNYDDRIYSIFNRIFRVPAEKLSDQTRMGDLEEWDSLGHILLIEALNEEFKVDIPIEYVLEIQTIHDIKRVIAELKK